MGRRLLTIGMVAALLIALPTGAAAADETCTTELQERGECITATNDDAADRVTLDGNKTQGGFRVNPTGPPESRFLENVDSDGAPIRVETEIFAPSVDGVTFTCVGRAAAVCSSIRRGPRIDDMLSFGAAPPTLAMEPATWIAVGLETNFIAHAPRHTLTGELLGEPASAEFIPIGYRFDYGDGTIVTTTTGGRTWADAGLAEFDATATSHRYSESGSYTITASVIYRTRAAFADEGEWFDIAGTLSVDTTITVPAFRVKTVLVSKDCIERPTGPGC